ncbi:MAG TPA: YraN family protein [Blastocatellia bacterium]|nr:YraN family protein [Blastocatellia bacterium]
MTTRTSGELGAYGERLAADYLKRLGWRIVAMNYTAPLGRSLSGREVTGEIDLIAYDESDELPVLSFIEVKTRSGAEFALPQAAVDRRKQRQIVRAARVYRRVLQLDGEAYRYDVVSVLVSAQNEPEITLLKGYFSERIFARSSWWSRAGDRF